MPPTYTDIFQPIMSNMLLKNKNITNMLIDKYAKNISCPQMYFLIPIGIFYAPELCHPAIINDHSPSVLISTK